MSDKKIQQQNVEESKISDQDMHNVLDKVLQGSDSNDHEIKKNFDQL